MEVVLKWEVKWSFTMRDFYIKKPQACYSGTTPCEDWRPGHGWVAFTSSISFVVRPSDPCPDSLASYTSSEGIILNRVYSGKGLAAELYAELFNVILGPRTGLETIS